MHVTMVKKRLRDGSECRKCAEAVEHLRSRGLLDRIDEIVWAVEDDPDSPGMELSRRLDVERAPFFVVRENGEEKVYLSVLRLIGERLGKKVSDQEHARQVDPDDIGGI